MQAFFGTKVFLADFLYHSTRGTFFPSSSDRKMNFHFMTNFFKNAFPTEVSLQYPDYLPKSVYYRIGLNLWSSSLLNQIIIQHKRQKVYIKSIDSRFHFFKVAYIDTDLILLEIHKSTNKSVPIKKILKYTFVHNLQQGKWYF